jgi:hypothetical protein
MPRQKQKKRVLALSIPMRETHGRPKEIGLFSATLGRISILTWSQNANRYCCQGRGGTFVCATGVGTTKPDPDFNTLNG